MDEPLYGKYRVDTTLSLNFPTLPSLELQPQYVKLIQKQHHHDVIILQFPSSSTIWTANVRTGVPMKFTWKQGQVQGVWYGYVSFISTEVVAATRKTMEVHCVGVTFPLKKRQVRVFKNSTITQAAKAIAYENGFDFVGEEHPQVFEQLVISGQSYWEWLQEQANKIGYALVIDGMTMHFRPVDKLIDSAAASVPMMAFFEQDVPYGMMFYDRTIDYFKALNGEYIEDSSNLRTRKKVGGVDPLSGKVILASQSPDTVGDNLREEVSDVLFDEHRVDQVVNSSVAADVSAIGAAHKSRFNMPAIVVGQGDPRLRPYGPVYVSGTGQQTDGYWVVKEVEHEINYNGTYMVNLTLLSDGIGKNIVTAARTGNGSMVGQVNLDNEVYGNGSLPNYTPDGTVMLSSPHEIMFEDKQGFKRTPTLWTSTTRKAQ